MTMPLPKKTWIRGGLLAGVGTLLVALACWAPGPTDARDESAESAVEAASRSLEKTTPGHIESLVRDIVRMRLDDGQLDSCKLTMQELTMVRQAFIFTLTTMLHGRVPYPKDESKDKQPRTPSRERQGTQETNGMVDDASSATG